MKKFFRIENFIFKELVQIFTLISVYGEIGLRKRVAHRTHLQEASMLKDYEEFCHIAHYDKNLDFTIYMKSSTFIMKFLRTGPQPCPCPAARSMEHVRSWAREICADYCTLTHHGRKCCLAIAQQLPTTSLKR